MASSIPLMNLTDSSVLKVRRNRAQQFADGEPHDQPVDDGHPLGAPPLGGLGDERVDPRQMPDGLLGQVGRLGPQLLRRRRLVGPLQREERLGRTRHVGLPDFPLIQDLQGRLAGAMPQVLFQASRGPTPAR